MVPARVCKIVLVGLNKSIYFLGGKRRAKKRDEDEKSLAAIEVNRNRCFCVKTS